MNVPVQFVAPPNVRVAAHHIVPVSLFKQPIGQKLHKLGIDLNRPQNGVWLPVDDYVGRTASLHRSNLLGKRLGPAGELKKSYVEDVIDSLRLVDDREEALALIEQIRNELLTTKGLLFRETGL